MQQDQNKQGLSWSTPSQNNAAPAAASSAPVVASSPVAGSAAALSDKKMTHTQAPVYAGLLVGGIIVGVLLATAWGAMGGDDAPGAAATTTPKATTNATPAAAATTSLKGSTLGAPMVVEDQSAGSDVAISRLSITKPTWVVVYVSRDGKPGNALGARLFFAGDQEGSVALLRDTTPGQTYFVGLSVDNGDRIFSLSRDAAVSDASGAVLWATFKAR
ncbi:MAG: hypothetical protein JWL87_400 [Candidatus Adlerbacteria bacterium]|nr:hypothetical protein [Candidatus Adlerbacteria bacterium]